MTWCSLPHEEKVRVTEARLWEQITEYCRLRQSEPVSRSPAMRALVEVMSIELVDQADRLDALILMLTQVVAGKDPVDPLRELVRMLERR